METALAGGIVRLIQGLVSAAPTLIVGLFVAAILRYYLGAAGTLRLFGGSSLRSLPQSWRVGMLLPVCSIGVIPIVREMKRMGVRPGAITAFALAAPLFNPLSLLYGLTLSRPMVIVGFAVASLAVVTILGLAWDRMTKWRPNASEEEVQVIGLQRLYCCLVYSIREMAGPTGWLTLLAITGLFLLGGILPHGALQSSVEQMDPMAPITMAGVAVPIYATPMLTMSQLGMMFAHGNSPGAAFCLLLLGTGMNLATLWWVYSSYGSRAALIWFSLLIAVVVGLAYVVDRPLIPVGVEPAGHTHAFDIYTNPLHSGSGNTLREAWDVVEKSVSILVRIGLGILIFLLIAGSLSRAWQKGWSDTAIYASGAASAISEPANSGWNRRVSSRTVGLTSLAGMVAFSVVACYAYYPAPEEVLEELRLSRVEVLSGVSSRDYERALHWIPIVEEWSRKLEVGYAIRHFELRPYQQMQAYLLRKKLELLEHATEHAKESAELGSSAHLDEHKRSADDNPEHDHEHDHASELTELRTQISATSKRLNAAFSQ